MEIKKTISDWAKGIFSGSSCVYEATIEELPSAPPFLFTGSTDSGFCVTIKLSSLTSRHNGIATTRGLDSLLGQVWEPSHSARWL